MVSRIYLIRIEIELCYVVSLDLIYGHMIDEEKFAETVVTSWKFGLKREEALPEELG